MIKKEVVKSCKLLALVWTMREKQEAYWYLQNYNTLGDMKEAEKAVDKMITLLCPGCKEQEKHTHTHTLYMEGVIKE